MILLSVIVIGLAASLLRARLNHRTLKLRNLRWGWLVITAVIPQILTFQIESTARMIPEIVVPIIQLVSMGGLLLFATINLTAPGFWALWLGLAGNLLVIIMNGGWMPISLETIIRLRPDLPLSNWEIGSRLGFGKDRIMNSAEINLAWLSDHLSLPALFPHIAFSIGDIFISIGAILLLWSLSRKDTEEK
jgi:hypothetical protein